MLLDAKKIKRDEFWVNPTLSNKLGGVPWLRQNVPNAGTGFQGLFSPHFKKVPENLSKVRWTVDGPKN